MNGTTVINIRTDLQVKTKAQEVAEKLGFSLSALINGYLRQLIKTKAISYNLSEKPSPYLIKALKEAEKDRKLGRISPSFDNVDDSIAWLEDPKRKYVNQL